MFNFLIAYGLALTHPLYVSVGTLLGAPLNVLVELILHGTTPSPSGCGGIVLILCGFTIVVLDDTRRDQAVDASSTGIGRGAGLPMAHSDAARDLATSTNTVLALADGELDASPISTARSDSANKDAWPHKQAELAPTQGQG
jgi:hypothetical protein